MQRLSIQTADSIPFVLSLCLIFVSSGSLAEEEFPSRIRGDVGGAVYASNSPIKDNGNTVIAVPYCYFDYGRFFARFDTFGFKTLPLGYGYLEVIGRVNLDGYNTNNASMQGIGARKNSIPLGIGTFQVTPVGGFFLNAFYDTNQSHGRIYEAIYAAQFEIGKNTVYPMVGFEHFSSRYTRYYYGISPAEAAITTYRRHASSATTNTMLCLVLEVPVVENWNASIYMLRRWLGPAITRSPLVNSKLQDEGFIALSYRYP
jgi:MipA family protein